MKQLVIYIAGPYRAATQEDIDANVQRAAAVGQELLRRGHVVVCPHTMTHNWDQGTGIADETFLETDLVLLSRCDAICMVEGWHHSAGARDELRAAHARGLLVFVRAADVPWAEAESLPPIKQTPRATL
jgi:hypothetical protein